VCVCEFVNYSSTMRNRTARADGRALAKVANFALETRLCPSGTPSETRVSSVIRCPPKII
jgi:hypothetical protein